MTACCGITGMCGKSIGNSVNIFVHFFSTPISIFEQTLVNKGFIHSEPSPALKWKTSVWYYWQQRVSGNCSSIYKWFARDSRDDLGKAAKDFNAAKDDGVAVALAGPYAYRLHDMIGCIHGGILPQTSHAEQSENEDQAIAKPRDSSGMPNWSQHHQLLLHYICLMAFLPGWPG